MARFTNIGMPRKTFVASAAEEASAGGAAQKPTENENKNENQAGPSGDNDGGKRKGWGRDPEIAKRAKLGEDRAEDRRIRRIEDRTASTVCFACRGLGHAARDCPNILLAASGEGGSAALLEAGDMAQRQAEALAGEDGEGEDGGKKKRKRGKKGDKGEKKEAEGKKGGEITGGKCYRCNSSLHSLSRCPKRVDHKDPTPFATCFVCLGKGHLSAACPQNPKGVYVNGGCCKVCKSVAHRARDCPEEARQRAEERGADWHDRQRNSGIAPQGTVGTGARAGADEDDFMVTSRDFVGNRTRHAPANNGQRRPAKAPGAEGAFVPEAAAAPAAKPVVKKKKVVAF